MRLTSLVAFVAAAAIVFASSVLLARAEAGFPRVRPLSVELARVLDQGRRDSPTLARLVDALGDSDLIVHIETQWFTREGVMAETLFIARAGGQRYVRIVLDARVPFDSAIALLGHELQHAWEIAQAKWVGDEKALAELYHRIGYRAGGADSGTLRVETHAGPAIQRQVRAEMRASRSLRGVDALPGAD